MEQICITLTGELAEMVNAGITSGRYRDAREMVMEALRRMEREIALASGYLETLDAVALSDLHAFETEGVGKKLRHGIARVIEGDSTAHLGRKGVRGLAAADIAPHRQQGLQLAQ